MWAHWRHLANTIELVLLSALPSPQPKRQIDRFSRFCTVHGSVVGYIRASWRIRLKLCTLVPPDEYDELMLASAHLSPQPKWQIDRFSLFCASHGIKSLYFTRFVVAHVPPKTENVLVCSRHQRLVTVVFRRCVQINLLTYLLTYHKFAVFRRLSSLPGKQNIASTCRLRMSFDQNIISASISGFLWPPYGLGQAIIFLHCGFFLLFSSFNLSCHRLDVYRTSTQWP